MVAGNRTERRILDNGGPIVIWDKREEGKRHRGLRFETSVCGNPRCAALHLRGHVIEETEDRLSTPLAADFDTDSGDVVVYEDAAPVDDRLLRLIEDSELPELLRRRWRRARGVDDRSSWRDRDWSWWDPGTLVAHCEVYPDAADLLFDQDGKDFWARDCYCVNPECDCRDVVLAMYEVGSADGAPLGTVTLDCRAWKVTKLVPDHGSADELRALWRELARDKSLRKTVTERYTALRAVSPELAEIAAAGPPARDLSPEEIIDELSLVGGHFPRSVVEEAIARREEMTPLFLEVLEKAIANPEDPVYLDSLVLIYAFFLLAQFRERQAYPLMLRLASLPEEIAGDLIDDFATEDMPRALASVAHGDSESLMRLARDRAAYVWSRVAALNAMVIMVAARELERDRAIELLREFARELLVDARAERIDDGAVYWAVVSCACELFPEDLQEEIDELFERGLVDETYIEKRYIAEALRRGKEQTLARTARRNRLITDTIADLSTWACFHEEEYELDEPEDDFDEARHDSAGGLRHVSGSFGFSDDGEPSTPVRPIVRDLPKVGRNDPCPCGSGKKYKRCCLGK